MFCLDGEVVFVHSKQVYKTGPSTLILVSTRCYLKAYLRSVMENVNPEFPRSDSKISVGGLVTLFLLA